MGVYSPAIGHANLTLPQMLGTHMDMCVAVDFDDWKAVEHFIEEKPWATKYYISEDSPIIDRKKFDISSMAKGSYLVLQVNRPMGAGSYKVYRYDPEGSTREHGPESPVSVKEHGFYADGWTETEFRIAVRHWKGRLLLTLDNPTPIKRVIKLQTGFGGKSIELNPNVTQSIELSVEPYDSVKGAVYPAFEPKNGDTRSLGLRLEISRRDRKSVV